MALASKFGQTGGVTGHVVRAGDYSLTDNSTRFTITAPGAGVVYLGETDDPGDFEVTVDGRPTPYFTANYAFKAIALPGAGTYRITFRYWPAHLTMYLGIAAAGAVLWVGAMAFFGWHLRRRATSVSTADNGATS